MRHRFLSESITHFKRAFVIIAILSLPGISLADKNDQIVCEVSEKFKLPKWYHEGLYSDGGNIWVSNGQKGNTWVVDASNGSIVKEIAPAGTFTEAITSKEKDSYIVTDWDLKKIYTARIEDGRMGIKGEISTDPFHPAGAVWNGTNLFVITWLRTLTGTKFHLLKMDDKFNILSRDAITNIQEPSGLAWDGSNLWISSWYARRIYKVDDRTLEILGHIRSPAKKTTGIAWAGKYLWVTGTYSDLYKMELKN
ncbi:MAG: hypothetical protein Q8O01_00475 [Candidatus Omnitrophota bacterium]|nr:hypothetical protein [Candidatus Omnitrophota bacterium]